MTVSFSGSHKRTGRPSPPHLWKLFDVRQAAWVSVLLKEIAPHPVGLLCFHTFAGKRLKHILLVEQAFGGEHTPRWGASSLHGLSGGTPCDVWCELSS